MKIWVIVIVAAALIVPILDYCLYYRPEQLVPSILVTFPSNGDDNSVQVMVRNCGQYTRQVGHLWWKRTQVDYVECARDSALDPKPRVVGEFNPAGDAAAKRALFTWACVACKQKLLNSVVVWGGASSKEMTSSPKLPLNLRLNQEDELQVMYTVRSGQMIHWPDVE